MIQEHRARALRYDPAGDVATVVLDDAPADAPRHVDALLLLDAGGRLVGVDLGGEGLARTVVLLGPFERVDATVPAPVTVRRAADGAPAEVRIDAARAAIRAHEPNPYTNAG